MARAAISLWSVLERVAELVASVGAADLFGGVHMPTKGVCPVCCPLDRLAGACKGVLELALVFRGRGLLLMLRSTGGVSEQVLLRGEDALNGRIANRLAVGGAASLGSGDARDTLGSRGGPAMMVPEAEALRAPAASLWLDAMMVHPRASTCSTTR
jgi:hypothetical protein